MISSNIFLRQTIAYKVLKGLFALKSVCPPAPGLAFAAAIRSAGAPLPWILTVVENEDARLFFITLSLLMQIAFFPLPYRLTVRERKGFSVCFALLTAF